MGFCSNCGEKIVEEAVFCWKCGTKIAKDVGVEVSASSEEFRETMGKIGEEMEKAFAIAAKEIQEAFQTARENIKKSFYKEPVICASCSEKNPTDAKFCNKCGKKITRKQD